MSNTKHTPGPWECSPIYPREVRTPVVNGTTIKIAFSLIGNGVGVKEAEANAKLIAASPSFFEYVLRKHNEGDVSATEVLKANGYA